MIQKFLEQIISLINWLIEIPLSMIRALIWLIKRFIKWLISLPFCIIRRLLRLIWYLVGKLHRLLQFLLKFSISWIIYDLTLMYRFLRFITYPLIYIIKYFFNFRVNFKNTLIRLNKMRKRHFAKYGYIVYVVYSFLLGIFMITCILASDYFGGMYSHYAFRCCRVMTFKINRLILYKYIDLTMLSTNTIELIESTRFADILLPNFNPNPTIRWYDLTIPDDYVDPQWWSVCQSVNEDFIKNGHSVRLGTDISIERFLIPETKAGVTKKWKNELNSFSRRDDLGLLLTRTILK